METPPLPPKPANGNWWTRNWKWFVPTGCLTIIVLFVVFTLSITLIVFAALKSSNVYKDAVARAKTSSAVIAALGSPIEEGMFVSGNTNVNGASGEANLAIPISGPGGAGKIYVVATKVAGQWNYSVLAVEIERTKQRIDLLQNSPTPHSL
ncbi:MAG TPA: cytochrome c oxidase assembly factor Coa1 family protein [Chthoniobacterales bacterium]|nr:cytochrome c oxidase assembly factor Coa1 family protein [Chthoniobacterales bacterium]